MPIPTVRHPSVGDRSWRGVANAIRLVNRLARTMPADLAGAFVHKVSDKDPPTSETPSPNDSPVIRVPTGWTLSTTEAVNEMGWIVGNGAGPGHSQQGFVLIPQPLVTQ